MVGMLVAVDGICGRWLIVKVKGRIERRTERIWREEVGGLVLSRDEGLRLTLGAIIGREDSNEVGIAAMFHDATMMDGC